MNKQELVSVIITSKNEGDVIGNLLGSITKQTYKNIEVILIDNNSSDKTLDIARKYHKVKVYTFGPERSAQRNFGAQKAHGKYLLFLDADMELTSNVVASCVEVAEKGGIAGVVIPEQSIATNFWGKIKAFERSFYNESGDPIMDAARFFSKDVFFEVGGYDETITGPEDWDLSDTIRKKGYKVGRSKEKIYHHEQTITLIGLFKKKFYYGLSADKYLRKQKVAVFSPKTVYFLRPTFYKSWKKLIKHPFFSLFLFLMLFVELLGGGLGFIVGKIRND